jgi:GT2 family glycosyltransferase
VLYDVAILIVTYNSERQIRACLQSVLDQRDHVSQQIIVLDNASTDQTVALVRKEFPDVELVTPGRNLGFAAGVNAAAGLADSEFLLLLNPDTEILDHAVDVIVDFARARPAHGLYGGRTLKPDGSLEPSSCWGLPTLWSMALFAFGLTTLAPRNCWLDPESLGAWPRDTVREVGVITGCFLLLSRAVWQRLGGLDERYFMYGEDVDLALRAHLAGYRPIVCPDARLVHEVGQSSAKPIDKMLLLYRGKAQLARTHWHGLAQRVALALLRLGVGLRVVISNVLGFLCPIASAQRWNQLWDKRSQWSAGYEAKPTAAPLT